MAVITKVDKKRADFIKCKGDARLRQKLLSIRSRQLKGKAKRERGLFPFDKGKAERAHFSPERVFALC